MRSAHNLGVAQPQTIDNSYCASASRGNVSRQVVPMTNLCSCSLRRSFLNFGKIGEIDKFEYSTADSLSELYSRFHQPLSS